MNRRTHMLALKEELRAQVALVQACSRRAVAVSDPRLKSAWIAAVVRLMDAAAATGSAIPDCKWAPPRIALLDFPLAMRPPTLPPLPNVEGEPLPPKFCKTT